MISTGPAPTFAGATVTLSSRITPFSSTRTGGRGLFSKSSSPQAASSTPHARNAAAPRATRIVTAANLPKWVAPGASCSRTAARRRSAAPAPATTTTSPGAASRRTSASAIGPSAGETQAEPDASDDLARRAAAPSPRSAGSRQAQAAQVAVRLALVVQPGDGLLADVAALREAHGALVDAGLLGDRVAVHVEAEARPAGLDPQALGGLLGDRLDARAPRSRPASRRRSRRRRGRSRRRGRARPRRRRARPRAAPRRARRAPRGRSATAARAPRSRPRSCTSRPRL